MLQDATLSADVQKDKPKPNTVKCKQDVEDAFYGTDLIYG